MSLSPGRIAASGPPIAPDGGSEATSIAVTRSPSTVTTARPRSSGANSCPSRCMVTLQGEEVRAHNPWPAERDLLLCLAPTEAPIGARQSGGTFNDATGDPLVPARRLWVIRSAGDGPASRWLRSRFAGGIRGYRRPIRRLGVASRAAAPRHHLPILPSELFQQIRDATPASAVSYTHL